MRLFPLLLLAGCQVPLDERAPSADPAWSAGGGPSFMEPTSTEVAGRACTFTAARWQGEARGLLEARWGEIEPFLARGLSDSPEALLADLATAPAERVEALTLALNLAFHEAGVYGVYADLGAARRVGGPQHGWTAAAVALQALAGADLLESTRAFNEGFGGCPADWYATCHDDLDRDGIPDTHDCDDLDRKVGRLLYDDPLDTDAGYFASPPQLPDPWAWDGDSVTATEGGQQALLGATEPWTDTVVFATLTAQGTRPGCGFECDESCGEYVPADCYADWQALGLGILTAETTASGVVTFTNTGAHDVCFEGFLMWDDPASQGLSIGEETLAGEYRVPAGGSLDVHYGSWTTANGVTQPYLGAPDLWCYQAGSSMVGGTPYHTIGSLLPEDLQDIITGAWDTDGDGVEDHVDWAGSGGVQTQYDLWSYQDTHAALVVGKLAASTPDGTVQVTLTAQNRGALAGTGRLTDTLPELWEVVSCSDAPDLEDGRTLAWDLALDGCTSACADFDEVVITCELRSMLSADLDIVELPPASIAYDDGDGPETSWSMPAAAFDYDHDADGELTCGETDRWRAGVLSRAALDGDQGEGYHGYRCALARNAEDDCYPAGHFLQIGEFMDAPEDDIDSECVEDAGCPNPTFDQLARVDHSGALDLAAGDTAALSFWIVGQDMVCTAWTGGSAPVVEARASDPSFASGGTGMSTLNMFGDFEEITVCEAHALP